MNEITSETNLDSRPLKISRSRNNMRTVLRLCYNYSLAQFENRTAESALWSNNLFRVAIQGSNPVFDEKRLMT